MPFENKRKDGPYNVEKGATYGKKFKSQKKEPWEDVFGPRHPVFDQVPNTTTKRKEIIPEIAVDSKTEASVTNWKEEFKDIKMRLKFGFKDEKVKGQFARDVLKKISVDALPLSCDNTTSTQINRVLPLAEPQDLVEFMKSMTVDLHTACTHRHASNITLTLMTRILEDYPRIVKIEQGIKEEESSGTIQLDLSPSSAGILRLEFDFWVISIAGFLLEGFDDLIKDWQAGHLIRIVLQILSGWTITDKSTGNRNVRRIASWILSPAKPEESVVKSVDVPDSYSKLFESFYRKIVSLPNLGDLIFYEDAVPVLVTLVLVVGQVNRKWSKKLVTRMMAIFDLDPGSEIEVTDVITSEIGTYVLQKALMLSSSKQLGRWWTGIFQGKLEGMVHHPQAFYMVIHLLDSCKDPAQLEEMCSELCPLMEQLMNANRHALMASLAEACRRLETCQEEYVKAIGSALHVGPGTEVMLVPLLTCLQHRELFWLVHEYKGDRTGEYIQKLNDKRVKGKIQIHQQGALILKSMAGFRKPKKIFKSMVGLDQKMLKEIICHGFGHDFILACVNSETARLKMKQKMIAHMKGKYHVLAGDMLGSRALLAMWKVASVRQRAVIAAELVEHEGTLKTNLHGYSVLRSVNTAQFVKHRGKWMAGQEEEAPKDALREEETD